VQFIHGLESGPGSSKAAYLARHFDAETPAMDTSSFTGSVALQTRRVLARPPDVLVGSSFGGAVALALLNAGVFRGPTLLLAPAHVHYGVDAGVPAGVPVVIVHGVQDSVVSIAGSRALAKTGTRGLVELVEVDDEHRLATLLEGDTLAGLVRRVFALSR
jgi:hypothetical protein